MPRQAGITYIMYVIISSISGIIVFKSVNPERLIKIKLPRSLRHGVTYIGKQKRESNPSFWPLESYKRRIL